MKVSKKNITKINYIILGIYILCFSIILFIFLKRRFFSNIEGLSKKKKKNKKKKNKSFEDKIQESKKKKKCRYRLHAWSNYLLGLSRGYGKPEHAFKLMYGKDYGRSPKRSAYPPTALKLNILRMEKNNKKLACSRQWLADLRFYRYSKELAEYKAKNK